MRFRVTVCGSLQNIRKSAVETCEGEALGRLIREKIGTSDGGRQKKEKIKIKNINNNNKKITSN
jgi:hypothetical protein